MKDSKLCPLCGARITFTGLFGVECQTVTCANAARVLLPPSLEPGMLAWAIDMYAQGKSVGWQLPQCNVVGPVNPNDMHWLREAVWRIM